MSKARITVVPVTVRYEAVQLADGTIILAELTEPRPRWAVLGSVGEDTELISHHDSEDLARSTALEVVQRLEDAPGRRTLQ